MSEQAAQRLLDDALRLQDAGAIWCWWNVSPPSYRRVWAGALEVPLIGIGAGPACERASVGVI
ncbi:MAG: 3-methyl-2-oxobutanoate hydroxymethyltransferase [Candidatus Competibacteraceae bacterium]